MVLDRPQSPGHLPLYLTTVPFFCWMVCFPLAGNTLTQPDALLLVLVAGTIQVKTSLPGISAVRWFLVSDDLRHTDFPPTVMWCSSRTKSAEAFDPPGGGINVDGRRKFRRDHRDILPPNNTILPTKIKGHKHVCTGYSGVCGQFRSLSTGGNNRHSGHSHGYMDYCVGRYDFVFLVLSNTQVPRYG